MKERKVDKLCHNEAKKHVTVLYELMTAGMIVKV